MSDNTGANEVQASMPKQPEPAFDAAKKNIYCARKPGWPGFVAVMVNEGSRKDIARDVADWVKRGYEIAGLFSRAEALAGLNEFSAERKRRAAEPAKAVVPQDGLFV